MTTIARTIISIEPASIKLLGYLLNSAIRTLALAGAAALGLYAFRVRNIAARLFTWTAVLYGALAMPLLLRMLPPLPVPAPTFLQYGQSLPDSGAQASQRLAPAAEHVQGGATAITRDRPRVEDGSSSTRTSGQNSSAPIGRNSSSSLIRRKSIPSARVASAIYLAGVLFFLIRLLVGLTLSRRLARKSRVIAEPRVTQRLADLARSSRIASAPQAAESECISVPVTVGGLRSKILLPSDWREWDDTRLDAVIAHELSHVARRDALTQCLSLLHRAVFWFSPLAWWLDRHLADLAEQASDEAALSGGADRKEYARTLLSFFEALHSAPGRVWWQGVSMAKSGQAAQRVHRILAWKEEVTKEAAMKGAVAMGLKKSIALAVVALAVPAVYVAASVRPIANAAESQQVHDAQSQSPTSPSDATHSDFGAAPDPALAPSVERPSSGIASDVATPDAVPTAAVAPRAKHVYPPIAAVAPAAPAPYPDPAAWRRRQSTSPESSYSSGYGASFSYRYGYDDNLRFIIGSGNSDSFTMSGSTEDAVHAQKLRKQLHGDFIWFERDEKSYIIRDPATIVRARKLWEPQQELGKKQEELGKQQETLGEKQEALGEKMEQVQVKVPDLTAVLDQLKAELKQLSSGSGATVEQVGHLQSAIGELQSKIGEIQSLAGEQQSKLGDQQGALGEKQEELGAKQGELGRQQADLAREANRQMKQLLDESLKNGTAQPEQN